MASWVFCNCCFRPPHRTSCFSLTNCGHVYCDVCLGKGRKGECLICKVPCHTLLLSEHMDADIRALFLGIDGLCRKYSRETSQVSEFQEKHRKRLLAFYREKISKLEECLRRSVLQTEQLRSTRLSQQTAFSTMKTPVLTPSAKPGGRTPLPPGSAASDRVESMQVDPTPSPARKMKGALAEIIQLATLDSDPWVLMVADILKSFPDTGALNLDLEEQNPNVQDILGELREKVNECEASAMLPLECRYLNKNALTTLAGPLTPPVKHFQLKRKPKSATLRAELLQKSTETAQQLKRSAGVPFHAKGRGLLRKMDTTTPLKGIPKQAPFRSPTTPSVFSPAGNRTPIPPSRAPLRKERGVKLLDISELDMVGAGREAKRRRKTLDAEVVEKPAKEETVVENATPDYAAGLVSTQKLGSLNSEPALPSTSYLPATPSVVPASSYTPSSETPPATSSREAGLQAPRPPEEPSAPSPALPAQFKQRAPMYNSGPSPATSTPSTPASPLTPTTPPAITPAAQTPPVAMAAPQTQPSAQQQPKKNLSLTREQMFAAQEMFKTANKVTRPEKALILGFMAGSRENPCQEQGDVIQIKLSEHTEDLPKSDGQGSTTMLVDTVFEMNYATGQWTRFKKYKPMANVS